MLSSNTVLVLELFYLISKGSSTSYHFLRQIIHPHHYHILYCKLCEEEQLSIVDFKFDCKIVKAVI